MQRKGIRTMKNKGNDILITGARVHNLKNVGKFLKLLEEKKYPNKEINIIDKIKKVTSVPKKMLFKLKKKRVLMEEKGNKKIKVIIIVLFIIILLAGLGLYYVYEKKDNNIKYYTLEEALEFIEDDELVEITPDDIRLRKKILDPKLRYRENNKYE